MEKRISVKTLYLIAIIVIGLVVIGVGSTYAIFTASASIDSPIYITSDLSYTSDIMETVDVAIAPGETEYIILSINNTSTLPLNYAIWFIDEVDDIDFGTEVVQNMYGCTTTCTNMPSDSDSVEIGIYIRNNSASSVIVTVGVSGSSSDIVLTNNMKIIPNQEMPALFTDISAFNYKIDE